MIRPEVETMIERAWERAASRPGVQLFDGPMCRLESWEASPRRLAVVLSETSYKPFLGTNLTHPELADRYGPAILANPVGVSPALITADGWLMMGRRNASVAYYPDRVHPFAGALDPEDDDPFAAIRRELAEELAFTHADLAPNGIDCTGIAEDLSIRQPELIFSAVSRRTRKEIEAKLDAREHHGSWATRATPQGVGAALASGEAFTPVAVAAMVLWGRCEFGDAWFDQMSGSGQ
jgi:8-oxo-dGTP pyrophosphatase MutT (NUDIX family)